MSRLRLGGHVLGLPTSQWGGGVEDAIEYLLRQEFTSATAQVGSLTYIENDGSFTFANGAMTFAQQTTAAWGDQGYYANDAITRARGVAISLGFVLTDTTGDMYPLTFLSAQNINNLAGANVNAGIVYTTGRYNPVSNGGLADFLNGVAGAPIINWPCRLAVVLRSTGAFLLIKGAAFPDWELLWVANTGNTATLYPGFSNLTIGGRLNYLRGANLPENGYTEWDDDYALATHRTASPADGVTATMESDAIVEFTWTAVTSQTLTILFRRTDDDNCYKLVCDQAGSTIKLYRREAGVDTELDAGKTQTWANSVQYRITVRCFGTSMDTIVNLTRKHSATAQTFNRDATGVKVSGFTTGANLICWQRDLSSTFKAGLDAISAEAAFPDNPNAFSSANAATALTIPTYDGSGQSTHPSVIDFGAGGWNGYRYWMAMTPYPNGDDTKENPSILASADGDTWVVPAGLTNPIVTLPGVGWYYSDPDLLYADGTMYIYYRSSEGTVDNVYIKSSTDGVTWSAQALLFTTTPATTMSPSVIWDGSQYVMYTINNVSTPGNPRKLQRRTCATPGGTWSAPTDCTYYGAALGVTTIWHLDVVKTDDGYHAVVSTAPGTGATIIFMTSVDGLTWYQSLTNLLGLGAGAAWDSGMLYRATITPTATGYDMWYSATNGDDSATWGIGRTSITTL